MSWLNEFVSPPEVGRLAERLSLAGLEVESIDHLTPSFTGVVVAKVLRVERHPNADRLTVCEVDAGSVGQFRVVCGAPNVRPGMVSALATVGARLGNNKAHNPSSNGVTVVQAAVIRGVESQGMLCSERELGLSDDHAGIVELDDSGRLGQDLGEFLRLDDYVLDISVTPNRGDCLSVLGIAREVAALFGLKVKSPLFSGKLHAGRRQAVATETNPSVSVEIEAPDLCPRYAALAMEGVKIAPAPLLIRRRLTLCGMRPINNVVDVTNYVMLELGQPLHAFDLDHIRGGKIIVRRAGKDVEFETLDHVRRKLDADDLVIADAERPVALAGVMGGLESEVTSTTKRILLESAFFEPKTIARTSRRFGLFSEASYRFERGIDRDGQIRALLRASELIKQVAGGSEKGPIVDVNIQPFAEPEVELMGETVARLLGCELPSREIVKRLRSLGIGVSSKGKGKLIARIPSYRPDLRTPADLIEELGRLNGFADVPSVTCRPMREVGMQDSRESVLKAVRTSLVGCGLFEIKSLAFASREQNSLFEGLCGDGSVKITNPLSADHGELRRSLLPGLLMALRFNLNREAQACHLFEIGKVFYRDKGSIQEAERLGLLSFGEIPLGRLGERGPNADFFILKGVVETCLSALGLGSKVDFHRDPARLLRYFHPGRQAHLLADTGELLGYMGELHPELAFDMGLEASPVALCELDLSALISYGARRRVIEPPPRFPAVRRDLALVLEREFPVMQVCRTVAQIGQELMLESVELFDVYEGAPIPGGKKSVALACRYRAKDRTLTDVEVNQLHAQLATRVMKQLGATLR